MKQFLVLQKSSKETYHWSLRKVRRSLEGFGGEFVIGKIAFDWKIYTKEEKKKENRRILEKRKRDERIFLGGRAHIGV